MQPILILSPLLGTLRTQGLRSIPAHLWAHKKAAVRQPILILSPLNPLKQKYHLPCPLPPLLLQYFLPLHLHLQVINAMTRPLQAIYVGVQPPPPHLAGPLIPPPDPAPPPPHPESGTEAGRSRCMARCCNPPPPGPRTKTIWPKMAPVSDGKQGRFWTQISNIWSVQHADPGCSK